MLTFRDITLEDRPWICRALRQSDFPGCEYSFANNLAWCRAAGSRIARAAFISSVPLTRRTVRRISLFRPAPGTMRPFSGKWPPLRLRWENRW